MWEIGEKSGSEMLDVSVDGTRYWTSLPPGYGNSTVESQRRGPFSLFEAFISPSRIHKISILFFFFFFFGGGGGEGRHAPGPPSQLPPSTLATADAYTGPIGGLELALQVQGCTVPRTLPVPELLYGNWLHFYRISALLMARFFLLLNKTKIAF